MYLWNIGAIGWRKDMNLAYMQYNLMENFFNGWYKGNKKLMSFNSFDWTNPFLSEERTHVSFGDQWYDFMQPMIESGEVEVIIEEKDENI